MDLNMELPRPDADLHQLRSYVYRLCERLNVVLHSIDDGSYTSSSAVISSSGRKEKSDVKALKQSIIRTASLINSVEEKLTKTLEDNYIAVSDIGTYTSDALASYEISGHGIGEYFSLVESIAGEVNRISGYVRSGLLDDDTVGIEIGSFGEENETPFKVRLCDNRLSFFDGNNEVAYLSDSTLYITRAEVKSRLTLGDYDVDLTDGVAFRWI